MWKQLVYIDYLTDALNKTSKVKSYANMSTTLQSIFTTLKAGFDLVKNNNLRKT